MSLRPAWAPPTHPPLSQADLSLLYEQISSQRFKHRLLCKQVTGVILFLFYRRGNQAENEHHPSLLTN
jgi:hypothetical protein